MTDFFIGSVGSRFYSDLEFGTGTQIALSFDGFVNFLYDETSGEAIDYAIKEATVGHHYDPYKEFVITEDAHK